MNYLAMGSLEEHLERVAARAEGGGHAASSSTLSRIYHASLKNLAPALRSLDTVEVFDNSGFGQRPRLVFECSQGKVWYIANEIPDWLDSALHETEYQIGPALRSEAEGRVSERDRSNFDR
jgi:predicted ABC-type ATPase